MKGKAHSCAFTKVRTNDACNVIVDYTDKIVKYVLISGVNDEDIKDDVLSCSEIDEVFE